MIKGMNKEADRTLPWDVRTAVANMLGFDATKDIRKKNCMLPNELYFSIHMLRDILSIGPINHITFDSQCKSFSVWARYRIWCRSPYPLNVQIVIVAW